MIFIEKDGQSRVPEHLCKIEGEVIDWETIFKAIDAGKYTFQNNDYSEASKAVAWLMFMIGNRVDMRYEGEKGSFAYLGPAKCFLQDFGYNRIQSMNYDPTYVDYMMNFLPVYVNGEDVMTGEGHAWVIDGRIKQQREAERRWYALEEIYMVEESWTEERVLYHCNYGWNGKFDGYYYSQVFDVKKGPEVRDVTVHDTGIMESGDVNLSRKNEIIMCFSYLKQL